MKPIIDVSEAGQAPHLFDFDTVSQNISGAIIRVGFTGWGGDGQNRYEDSDFRTYYKEFKKRGVPVGAYFYSVAHTPGDGKRDAEFVLETIRGLKFELPIWWDIENDIDFGGPGWVLNAGADVVTDCAIEFLEAMEQAGYYTGFYTFTSWAENQIDLSRLNDYDFWLAQYVDNVDESYECSRPVGLWQYTSTGFVEGYPNVLDCNIPTIDYPSIIIGAGLNGYGNNKVVEYTKPMPQKLDKTDLSLAILNTTSTKANGGLVSDTENLVAIQDTAGFRTSAWDDSGVNRVMDIPEGKMVHVEAAAARKDYALVSVEGESDYVYVYTRHFV